MNSNCKTNPRVIAFSFSSRYISNHSRGVVIVHMLFGRSVLFASIKDELLHRHVQRGIN